MSVPVIQTVKVTKKQLRKYLLDRWDVTVKQIMQDFKLPKQYVPIVLRLLAELEKEGCITKSHCFDCGVDEYDPALGANEVW